MKKRAFVIVITLLFALALMAPLSAAGLSGPKPPETASQAADACGATPDRTGGPDAFGYTFKDSAEPTGPAYSWVDISTTGAPIAYADDNYFGPFALGFSLNFYGTDYTQAWTSSNGWLSVTAPTSSDFSNDCPLPNTGNTWGIVAGVWDDLIATGSGPQGGGYWQAYAAGACPWGGYTGACFITEWKGMYYYAVTTTSTTFEEILLDNGNIVVQYQTVGTQAGVSSTEAIQNVGSTIALTYACNTAASIADSLAVEYYYPPAAPRLDQSTKTGPATIHTGQNIPYTIVVNNTGFLTATGTTLVDPIPTGATYVAGSVTGGATYNAGLNQIEFTGDIPMRGQHTITFLATATATSGNIVNTATISQTQIPAPVTVQATTAATAVAILTVNPTSLQSAQATNTTRVLPLTLGNVGFLDLNWQISELPARAPEAVIYDNGPLITHPGGGAGGADASALQTALGLTIYGFGNQISANNRVADDFVVTAAGGWQVDTITFYGYQTNSGITPSINNVNLQIWNGRPGDPGATVIWGDPTTNRLATASFSNIYRVLDTDLLNTARPIMRLVVNVNTLLTPGTYWLDWQVGGTLASGPWAPPISILGQTTTGNGRQSLVGTWGDLLDGTLPQGLPFTIDGTAFNCVTDIPWVSESPVSGTIAPAGSQPVNVTFDSTGLANGTYTGNLCVASNDPDRPLVMVPITLTVRPPTATTVTDVVATSGTFLPVGLAVLGALALTGAVVALRKRR